MNEDLKVPTTTELAATNLHDSGTAYIV